MTKESKEVTARIPFPGRSALEFHEKGPGLDLNLQPPKRWRSPLSVLTRTTTTTASETIDRVSSVQQEALRTQEQTIHLLSSLSGRNTNILFSDPSALVADRLGNKMEQYYRHALIKQSKKRNEPQSRARSIICPYCWMVTSGAIDGFGCWSQHRGA